MSFINFTAASRKPHLRRFGLASTGDDLTYILDQLDMRVSDLSQQITGSNTQFTLPEVAVMVEDLLWNNITVLSVRTLPGYVLDASRQTVTLNFTPQVGDTLVARFWPK